MRQAYNIKQSESEKPALRAALTNNTREVLVALRDGIISTSQAALFLKALAEEVLSVDAPTQEPNLYTVTAEKADIYTIIAEETTIPDGEYRALWTGAVLDVYVPGKETCIKVKTNVAVKGVDIPVKVLITKHTVYKV